MPLGRQTPSGIQGASLKVTVCGGGDRLILSGWKGRGTRGWQVWVHIHGIVFLSQGLWWSRLALSHDIINLENTATWGLYLLFPSNSFVGRTSSKFCLPLLAEVIIADSFPSLH